MEARFRFTFQCLDKIKQINPQENAVFSPYGLYDALLLFYLASSDEDSDLNNYFLKYVLFLENVSKDKLTEYYALERKTYLQSKVNNSNALIVSV